MKELQIKKHMLTAISYLIPFVCTAGMLMVIGNIAGGSSVEDFTKQLAFPDFLTTIGGTALGFLPIVISTGISYSIADKAGIAPGIILGLLCKDAGFGFLGGANQRLSGRISDCLSVKSYESTKMGCRIVASVNSSTDRIPGGRAGHEICDRNSDQCADQCDYRSFGEYAEQCGYDHPIWNIGWNIVGG